jgi:hypothetical protein
MSIILVGSDFSSSATVPDSVLAQDGWLDKQSWSDVLSRRKATSEFGATIARLRERWAKLASFSVRKAKC